MIINEEENSVDFNHVFRVKTSINDADQTIKVNNLSFSNDNCQGDFMSIQNVSDLKALHSKGMEVAKSMF